MVLMDKSRALAFGIGATTGIAIGVLFAPRPGKETREALAESKDRTREKLNDYRHVAANKIEGAKDWARQTASSVGEKVKALPIGARQSEDGNLTD